MADLSDLQSKLASLKQLQEQNDGIVLPNGGLSDQEASDYAKLSAQAPAAPSTPTDVGDLMSRAGVSAKAPLSSVASSEPSPAPSLVKSIAPLDTKSSDTIPSSQAAPLSPNVPSNLYGSDLGDEAIKAAQDRKAKLDMIAGLSKASGLIGEGLLKGSYKAPDLGTGLKEQGTQGVQNILERRKGLDSELKRQEDLYTMATEKDKTDPNSDVSKMSRDLLKQMSSKAGLKFDVKDNMSLASIEKIYGPMERYFGQLESANARRDAAADRAALLKSTLDSKKEEKTKEAIVKQTQLMGKDLDPNVARAGALGKSQQVVNDTEALEALAHNYSNLDKVPSAQYAEMASALDRLVSRGNPSVEKFKHLMPSNMELTGNTILQYLKSSPTGAGQGDFIKSILNTAQAERATAQAQIAKAQLEKAYSTHKKLHDLAPDDFYNNLMEKTHMSLDDIKAYEKDHKIPTPLSSEDKEAIDWAKDPKNASDPRAKLILQQHGM